MHFDHSANCIVAFPRPSARLYLKSHHSVPVSHTANIAFRIFPHPPIIAFFIATTFLYLSRIYWFINKYSQGDCHTGNHDSVWVPRRTCPETSRKLRLAAGDRPLRRLHTESPLVAPSLEYHVVLAMMAVKGDRNHGIDG